MKTKTSAHDVAAWEYNFRRENESVVCTQSEQRTEIRTVRTYDVDVQYLFTPKITMHVPLARK